MEARHAAHGDRPRSRRRRRRQAAIRLAWIDGPSRRAAAALALPGGRDRLGQDEDEDERRRGEEAVRRTKLRYTFMRGNTVLTGPQGARRAWRAWRARRGAAAATIFSGVLLILPDPLRRREARRSLCATASGKASGLCGSPACGLPLTRRGGATSDEPSGRFNFPAIWRHRSGADRPY